MLANKNRGNSYIQATSVTKYTQEILESNKGRNSLNQIWQTRNLLQIRNVPLPICCTKSTHF